MHAVNANGAEIPALGLGTWLLRGRSCVEIVAEALKLGYRHVDTAVVYQNESEVGEGIRASGVAREDFFLTTKVWPPEQRPGDLERSAEASLRRLGVSSVDLLLIHWPNPDLPVETIIKALNGALRAGLTKHVGVSNFTTSLLAAAVRASEAPLVCNQVEYHPYLNQAKVHAACRANGMALVSYCPLFRGGPLFEEPAVRDAAARHGKSPGQVVLRWHVQQDGVVAIPKTSRVERLSENLDIFDFQLSADEMAAISALGVAGRRLCDEDEEFAPKWDAA